MPSEQLAFCRINQKGTGSEIYLHDLKSKTSHNLTNSSDPLEGNFWPTWSPDGKYLAWVHYKHPINVENKNYISIMQADGSKVASFPLTHDAEFLAWSPDGKSIAFLAHGNIIGILDIESGKSSHLSSTKQFYGKPIWSPDSKSILYVRVHEDFYRLCLVSVETDQTRFLFDPSEYNGFQEKVWLDSQNIRIIMENTAQGTFKSGIYNVNLDGKVTLLFDGLDATHYSLLELSPDGTQMAYFSFVPIPLNRIADYPEGVANLHIMNVDGTQRREVVHHTTPSPIIVWSPDQKKIAWQTPMTSRIYMVSTTGGSEEIIAERTSEPVWRP